MSPHTLQKLPATAGLMPGRLSYLVQENPLVHHHLTGWLNGEGGGVFGQFWHQLKKLSTAKFRQMIQIGLSFSNCLTFFCL